MIHKYSLFSWYLWYPLTKAWNATAYKNFYPLLQLVHPIIPSPLRSYLCVHVLVLLTGACSCMYFVLFVSWAQHVVHHLLRIWKDESKLSFHFLYLPWLIRCLFLFCWQWKFSFYNPSSLKSSGTNLNTLITKLWKGRQCAQSV